MRVIALTGILWLALAAAGARAELRTFELQHADAAALLPSVQALLGPYESASVYRDTLVVNAGIDALARVEALIATLDRPLRNLLITLRRRGSVATGTGGASVEGSVEVGGTRISTTRQAREGSQITIRGGSGASTRERAGEQSVRALEGSTVMVRDGELVALARGGAWGPRIDYTGIEQGFAVTARVSGDTVRVEVDARDERVEDGTIRSTGIDSAVSGALGAWIPLGGASRDESARIDGTGVRYGTRSRAQDDYEIRVELSP